MRLLLQVCASLTALFIVSSTAPASASASAANAANAAKDGRAPRPTITSTRDGRDLRIVVHGVTDYCSSDAQTEVFRTSDAIRILHDRPTRVSRCISTKDLTFVVKDVGPGRYRITYERMPYVAPASPRTVASAMVTVR